MKLRSHHQVNQHPENSTVSSLCVHAELTELTSILAVAGQNVQQRLSWHRVASWCTVVSWRMVVSWHTVV